jgi:hypothetical protein
MTASSSGRASLAAKCAALVALLEPNPVTPNMIVGSRGEIS